MTGPSPWAAPPETGPQQTPQYAAAPTSFPPQAGPPVAPPRARRHSPWLLVGGVVVLLIAVIAATAAVTYAVTRNSNAPNVSPAAPTSPQFSAADQAAAKQQLCQTFDVSVRGSTGQGGMRQNGQLNVPVALRAVNSAVAVQNSLKPAVPQEIADVAHGYIDATLAMTAAASGNPSNDEVNHLTDVANKATDAFADACGLPR